MPRTKKWIQRAIKRKGRVHKYVSRLYGEKAFTKRGTIKEEYLRKALKHAKEEGNVSLERAILLAKRLRRMK